MMLNISLKQFKINHKKKINQILYLSLDSDGSKEIINLINNFLLRKMLLYLNQQKKDLLKVDIQFLEKILIKFGNLIIM